MNLWFAERLGMGFSRDGDGDNGRGSVPSTKLDFGGTMYSEADPDSDFL